jgi:hypothetical protein
METNLPETTPPPRKYKARGPHPFVPTDGHRNHVKLLACLGLSQEQIAESLDLTVPTLRKFFRDEMHLSAVDANPDVLSSLTEMAAGRHQGAGDIVWVKTEHGYRPGVGPSEAQTARWAARLTAPLPVICIVEQPSTLRWRTIRRKLKNKLLTAPKQPSQELAA